MVRFGDAVLHLGKCEHVLPTMPDNSVDSVVCDPPYGLGFMGKSWDHGVPSAAVWREVLRVLKPGGHLLAFAGSRTYHRMACAIEDGGFEIRDQIMWVYGSGFPKSMDISKAGASDEWQGWGTALKPAHEPIVVARKPITGTVAANVLQWGTGGLNIDGCRVDTDEILSGGSSAGERKTSMTGDERSGAALGMFAPGAKRKTEWVNPTGRFPANLIHDGSPEVIACFPDAPGQLADASTATDTRKNQNVYGTMQRGSNAAPARVESDKSAARFFYVAKASRADRGEFNNHPTVKPRTLMRYLCRLVTPPGGTVLDCFAGSGSTGLAALDEGFSSILIEENDHNFTIACMRIAGAMS